MKKHGRTRNTVIAVLCDLVSVTLSVLLAMLFSEGAVTFDLLTLWWYVANIGFAGIFFVIFRLYNIIYGSAGIIDALRICAAVIGVCICNVIYSLAFRTVDVQTCLTYSVILLNLVLLSRFAKRLLLAVYYILFRRGKPGTVRAMIVGGGSAGTALVREMQTTDKIKSLIPGLKNEDSLDSFWEGAITDSGLGTIPVYIPDLKDSSSKLLDVVTMNRIIHQAIPDLDSGIKKVIVYYIDITSEEEIRKFIAQDDSTDVEIELRDLKAVLDGVVIGDWAEFHVEERTDNLFGRYAVVVDAFVSDRVLQKIDEFNQKARMNATAKKPFKPIEISDAGLELIEYLSLDCTASQGEWHSDSEIKIDKNGFVIRNGEKTKEFWDGTIRSEKKPLRLKIRNICGDETVWEV